MSKDYIFYFFFFVLIAGINTPLSSQNTGYAPFYYNAMDYNPASTGGMPELIGSLSHRHNFNDSSFSSHSTNFHAYFYDRAFWRGAFGLSANFATKGKSAFKKNQLSLSYAKKIMVSPDFMIQLGAKGGFVHKKANSYNSLNLFEYQDALPPSDLDTVPLINTTQNCFDVSAGALVMFNIKLRPSITFATATVGAGFNHLNTPKEQWFEQRDFTVRLKSNIHTNLRVAIRMKDRVYFVIPALLYEFNNPSDMLSLHSSKVNALTYGANFEFPIKKIRSCIHTGIWLKNNYVGEEALHFNTTQSLSTDSYSFLLAIERILKWKYRRYVRFSYGFDMPRSDKISFSKAIHEFTLSIGLPDIKIPGKWMRFAPIRYPVDRFFQRCKCC